MKPTILSYTQRNGSRVIDINNLHDFYAYIYASRMEYNNGILHLQDIQGEPDEVARSIDGFIYEKLEHNRITDRTCHIKGKKICMDIMKELEQFYF